MISVLPSHFVTWLLSLMRTAWEIPDGDNFDFDFNFNPLVGLDMFALQSKLNVDLKVSDLGEKFSAKGYFNLDDLSITEREKKCIELLGYRSKYVIGE